MSIPAGLNTAEIDQAVGGSVEPRSITIYRYYDQVSSVFFGPGKQVTMEDFGRGLSSLIMKLRDCVSDDPAEKAKFKVYLVGHSMGGLVIRCFLQNDQIGDPVAKTYVDKVFTYATPHNGIYLDIIGNVPAFFTAQSVDNFNRNRMRSYLGLPADAEQVNTLNGKFDVDKFFCLIGTNPKDYTVAAGWSARVVGPFSDGLVRINNAAVVRGTDQRSGQSHQIGAALVRLSKPLRILRDRQFRRWLPEPDPVPVRRCTRGRTPRGPRHQPAQRGRAGAPEGQASPCLLPIRGYCIGPRCTLGFQPPGGERELDRLPDLWRPSRRRQRPASTGPTMMFPSSSRSIWMPMRK